MAQMSKQGAIRLAKPLPQAFTFHRIGFEHVNSNDTIAMAGYGIAGKIERERAALRTGVRRWREGCVQRQPKPQKPINKPLLGQLQFTPCG
jgi:hypothetical protein